MVVENDFVPFAAGGSANVLSQSSYLASSSLPTGSPMGSVASSQLVNKALRQATYIASCLAQWLVNKTGNTMLDDGTSSEVITTMGLAWQTAPTFTKLTSGSGTYTVPAGVLWLEIEMVGGGGGGGATTNGATGIAGTVGGNTTFGVLTAFGGQGGLASSAGGSTPSSGGSASLGPGAVGTAQTGSTSQGISLVAGSPFYSANGASSVFGGGGYGAASGTGGAGATNSGGGGGGGASDGLNCIASGGGSGGYVYAKILSSLASTYSYGVGVGGAGGVHTGTGSNDGGQGGAGLILITEHYQ